MATRPACFYCGGPTFYIPDASRPYAFTRDHVVPKYLRLKLPAKQRQKICNNIVVPCCARCNQLKGSKRVGDFIRQYIPESRWGLIDWVRLLRIQARTGFALGWVWPEAYQSTSTKNFLTS